MNFTDVLWDILKMVGAGSGFIVMFAIMAFYPRQRKRKAG